MKILVCGGRDFNDFKFIHSTLDSLNAAVGPITCVVHGGAPGSDWWAGDWANENGIPVLMYPADWAKHGRRAGPIRNSEMLAANPDIAHVVAFPGGKGTADMVKKAKAAGIETLVHSLPEPHR